MHHFLTVNLGDSTKKLEDQPFFFDKGKLRNTMQLFLQVVADKLSHTEQSLRLEVVNFVIDQDIGMLN